MGGEENIAHQIPHILVALIIIGIFGSVIVGVFFQQTVDPSIQSAWVIIPAISIISIIVLILNTAIRDRD